jgi:hypothetical protein
MEEIMRNTLEIGILLAALTWTNPAQLLAQDGALMTIPTKPPIPPKCPPTDPSCYQ